MAQNFIAYHCCLNGSALLWLENIQHCVDSRHWKLDTQITTVTNSARSEPTQDGLVILEPINTNPWTQITCFDLL